MMFTTLLFAGLTSMTANASANDMFTTTEPTGPVVTHNVDKEASTIVWRGYKVTGKHHGEVELKSGNLEFAGDQLTGGTFEINMASIEVLDLSGGTKEKLEGHLKSDDFFGVNTHPVATFTITQAIPYGTNGQYKIVGDLTIKGITKEIKFPAQVTGSDDSRTATAKITIDRSEYNVRYGSGSFFDNLGDKTIYDEFDLEVTLQTRKAS